MAASLPRNGDLPTNFPWESTQASPFARMGKPLDTSDKVKWRIEAAELGNVHEKLYKVPLRDWVKDPLLNEVGRF